MIRYLLDTDICIYIAKQRPSQVLLRLKRTKPGELGISVITYLELVYGAWKSEPVEANLAKIEEFRHLVPVQSLDANAAQRYARLRTQLERRGSPIGDYDLLIAAHALSMGLALVTNNIREFGGVPGLRVENWVE